ncbi:serine/threonine-protein kinase SBK1-like [Rana temporaria]|uniref:serine/threonine-protein kinase SBK1-like n=1 Tax=Rana temporaria TaxID=8407 RepID=UPI001AACF66F|nr:serine/threonine-protein kinase SBK1-like [Rana temporaria]
MVNVEHIQEGSIRGRVTKAHKPKGSTRLLDYVHSIRSKQRVSQEEKEGTMASINHDVEGLLDRLISFSSHSLHQIDLEKYFLIVKELGKGGYGKVVLAKDRKTDHRMALKVMDKNRTSQQSFLLEFSISFLLSSHPNIIGCCGTAFTTTDHFVFVQELAPVGDLFSLILPNVGIPEDAVKRCTVQISSALEFIAEKGLVHMDMKPENILVFDRECHCIKLTDFGFARIKGTVIRTKVGSISFMAPEMCTTTMSDGLAIDGSLDVWAFGVLIYCLLTGESPWQVAMTDDKEYKCFVDWQNSFKTYSPPEAWSKVPTGIRRMFIDLLAIDSTKRSPSVEVLKYISESWKEEIPDSATRNEDENPIQSSSSVQPGESLPKASNLNTSQSSDSNTSTLSNMSCLLSTEISGSQTEMTPGPQKDNMAETPIMFDDK